MNRVDSSFIPGNWVLHPDQPDWGPGQIQSSVGMTVTVNFEHAGKRVINVEAISLRDIANPDDPPCPPGDGRR